MQNTSQSLTSKHRFSSTVFFIVQSVFKYFHAVALCQIVYTLRGVTRKEKTRNPKNFFTRVMSSRLIPKKLTTGIVVSDTEDLEATDASDRALTSALCGALQRSWLTSGLGCRCLCLCLMWTTSRNLKNRTRTNNSWMGMVC